MLTKDLLRGAGTGVARLRRLELAMGLLVRRDEVAAIICSEADAACLRAAAARCELVPIMIGSERYDVVYGVQGWRSAAQLHQWAASRLRDISLPRPDCLARVRLSAIDFQPKCTSSFRNTLSPPYHSTIEHRLAAAMSFSDLVGGTACGPSNPLQNLGKRFGQDRSTQFDRYGSGSAAGPSSSSVSTVARGMRRCSRARLLNRFLFLVSVRPSDLLNMLTTEVLLPNRRAFSPCLVLMASLWISHRYTAPCPR